VLAVWPGATFDVFGDGPERTALTALAGRLGVGDRVRWHGASSHADVIAGVARSHLHWFTTLTGRDGRTEGVPNILKETQAAGLPAVAFDHPGVDEVVLPGETGLTVPEGDVAGLVAATLELAADGDLARRMGRLASDRARAAFDLDQLTGRLEAVYRAAVDGDSLDPALLA
jgi:glycosyltransferase involved in cell wall biosynthesis